MSCRSDDCHRKLKVPRPSASAIPAVEAVSSWPSAGVVSLMVGAPVGVSLMFVTAAVAAEIRIRECLHLRGPSPPRSVKLTATRSCRPTCASPGVKFAAVAPAMGLQLMPSSDELEGEGPKAIGIGNARGRSRQQLIFRSVSDGRRAGRGVVDVEDCGGRRRGHRL